MLFFLLSFLAATLFLSNPPLFAQEFIPVSKRYTLDLPEGWSTRDNESEKFSRVYVVNPKEDNGMKIVVTPYSPEEGESVEEYLKRRVDHMVVRVDARDEGKVFRIDDVEIDGVSAKHMHYQMMTDSGLQQASQTVLIHEDYQYMMTYGSADLDEKARMDSIAATLRFLPNETEPTQESEDLETEKEGANSGAPETLRALTF